MGEPGEGVTVHPPPPCLPLPVGLALHPSSEGIEITLGELVGDAMPAPAGAKLAGLYIAPDLARTLPELPGCIRQTDLSRIHDRTKIHSVGVECQQANANGRK